MPGKGIEHMVKKTDPGLRMALATAIEAQL
jgi:hypothetical protein